MNIAQETMKLAAEIVAQKEKDLSLIAERLESARLDERKAIAAMEEASDKLDAGAYAEAQTMKESAQMKIRMLTQREEKLRAMRAVSEAESDSRIDSLLVYEDGLRADFECSLAGVVKDLEKLYNSYFASVREAEQAISTWTAQVHPNYRSPNTTYPDGTRRSPVPVPVHLLAYFGGNAAEQLESFLRKIKPQLPLDD